VIRTPFKNSSRDSLICKTSFVTPYTRVTAKPVLASWSAIAEEVAMVSNRHSEVVQAHRRIGMLGAEHLLADRQRALEERPRRRQLVLVLQQRGRRARGQVVGLLKTSR
jgi:hypothetical protein